MSTTFSAIDVGQKVVAKELIDILKQNLFLYKTAKLQKVPMGANSKTVVFRGFTKLAVSTTPLTEGTVPSGHDLAMTTISVTLAEYGDFTKITDVAEFLYDRNLIEDAAGVLGVNATEVLDTVVVNVIAAGTTVLYGDGSVASRVTVTGAMKMTTGVITRAVRFLERNNVKKFASIPIIGNAYVLAVHPDVAADIRLDTNFINAVNYSSPTPTNENRGDLFTGELGNWMGARVISSTIMPVYAGAGAAGATIYGSLLYGEGAYAVTEFEGGLSTFVKDGGAQDTSNPLNQFGTVGWKWMGAAAILDNNRIARLETSATYTAATI